MLVVANLISLILHPFIIEIGTFLFLSLYYSKTILAVVFISVVPAFLVLFSAIYLKKMGKLTDYNGKIRKERLHLISLGVIYHGLGFLLLQYFHAPKIIQGLMFCYSLNTAFVWIITTKWRISIHAIGLGGPLVALWLSGMHYPIFMFSLMIILCASRLLLKAHTLMQVVMGSLFSISFAYFQLKYLFLIV
jgi:membrane-associated phospholipid phosphatase